MTAIELHLDFVPATATAGNGRRIMRRRDGTAFIGHSASVKAASNELRVRLRPYRPPQPMEGPVSMVCRWTWPWPEKISHRDRLSGWQWRDTKPDLDNLSKALFDALEAEGFVTNDSQFVCRMDEKRWGDCPGLYLLISPFMTPPTSAKTPPDARAAALQQARIAHVRALSSHYADDLPKSTPRRFLCDEQTAQKDHSRGQ